MTNKAQHDSISGLLSGDVKYKGNRIKDGSRYSKKSPEVMVKISGHCYSSGHTLSHFDYISRNSTLNLKTKPDKSTKIKPPFINSRMTGMVMNTVNKNEIPDTTLTLYYQCQTAPSLRQ